MAETLYRKYRPQTFAEIVNQQHIRITLQHALEQDRVAHAYLFAGPRGVGKTTVARLVARAVNCQKRQGPEPCNNCPPCLAMTEGRSLDIIEIDAASQTGVDNVRENIIQSARVAPSLGTMKVFIIDEVHMLSLAAFNALLKLLEEPPAHALFILATTEIHRVPETIISRTQRFDFKKLSATDIHARLTDLAQKEKRTLEKGVADRIARFADGSLRDAESMLGQLFSFQDKTISNDIADLVLPKSNEAVLITLMEALVRKQGTAALQTFHQFCDEGGDVPSFTHDVVELSRGLMLGAVDVTLLDTALRQYNPSTATTLRDLLAVGDAHQFMNLVENFTAAERQLYRGALLELPVEIAIIKSTMDFSDPTVPSPLARPTAPSKPQPLPPAEAPKRKSATSAKSKSTTLSIDAATKAWHALQRDLEKAQPSLRLSAQQAWVANIGDHKVILSVPFALHQQRLTDPRHRKGLEEQLADQLGLPVTIEVQVETGHGTQPEPPIDEPRPATVPKKSSGELWDQVVASFS